MRYLIPWEDCNTPSNPPDASFKSIPPMDGEASFGVAPTMLWWDADSSLLNGTSRHSLFLPTSLPLADAICPSSSASSSSSPIRRGIRMEIWCKFNAPNVPPAKVGHAFLPYEDLEHLVRRAMTPTSASAPGPLTVQRQLSLPLTILTPSAEAGGFRASEFLPSSLKLMCMLVVEPKIVGVRRKQQLQSQVPASLPRAAEADMRVKRSNAALAEQVAPAETNMLIR